MAEILERAAAERARSAEEKDRMQRQLAQAQKMEALGELTGRIAHDFNNSLVAIKGNVDLAIDRVGKRAPVYGELAEIRAAGDRAARLTHQLLMFGRRQMERLEIVDLNRIVASMSRTIDMMAGENVMVTINLSSDLKPIRGDAGGIEQVIMNLVVNAKDAMPAGGSLVVSTESVEMDEVASREHPGARPGAYSRLTVSDSGVGMTPETMGRVFEPFFTTKAVGAGVGWGLTIIYGIVRQHEGWIEVGSAPGAGTTFTVYLPAAPASVIPAPPSPAEGEQPRGFGERILVVEDDNAVRGFVIRALVGNSYRMRSASSVREALEIVKEENGAFDLVLADVVLPDGDGLQLVDKIAERFPRIAFLMNSGYVGDASRRETIERRGLPFLEKPFSIGALLRAVRDALGRDTPAR